MNDELNDPILDALLDEVLGDAEPPNLTGRILDAWSARQAAGQQASGWPLPIAGSASTGSEPIPPPIQVPGGSGPAVVSDGLAGLAPGSPTHVRRNGMTERPARHARRWPDASPWQRYVLAASLLLAAATVSLWVVFLLGRSGQPQMAQPAQPPQPALPTQSTQTPASDQLAGPTPTPEPSALMRQSPTASRGAAGDTRPAGGGAKAGNLDGVNRNGGAFDAPFNRPLPFEVVDSAKPDGSSQPPPVAPTPDPLPDAEVVAFVNTELQRTWQQYAVQPAGTATDEEWCRRVFLRILGRIPTVEELQRFVLDRSPTRRQQLVDRLLDDSEYSAQLADHWAGVWTNVLVGRTGGVRQEGPGSRQGLRDWLRDAIERNRPFDELAGELISASGSTDPADEDFNGAVHFLMLNQNDRATLATARTSQSLLGKQLQCAQCHHHPTNDWAQQQFWELNAFFRQMHVQRDDRAGHYRLVNQDFQGEGGQDPAEAEVYFERLDGKLQAAYPVFLGQRTIPPSGRVSDVDRRAELARLVASSDDLSRSVVNRLWAHFLGHGFTTPVDDMGPHSPPSHPELLDGLAGQFAAHNHDLRSLMRWITLSEAFGLSSRVTGGAEADQPDAGGIALFSRYYTRQLPPEEVYQSLEMVASARAEGQAGGAEQAKLDWLSQFSRNMGTDDGTETNRFTGDIRQSLIIMNGPLMRQATTPAEGSVLQRVLESKLPVEEKVEHLFLAALARRPTQRESGLIGKMLQSAGDQQTALQDIWWALLNSNEFILDH